VKRAWLTLMAGTALALPAQATWGIVLINHATREVGVACATCIQNIDLRPRLPSVRPGLGVGNVQAWWDQNGSRRKTMWDGFGAGKSPQEVFEDLRLLPQHYNYQFGLAGFNGPPVTYTGTTAGDGICNLTGTYGPWSWAIQGNVITGEPVCLAAEQAIINTPGDLATKLMAGMEAARSMGGDGRCSCSQADPDGCGSPPPNFTKSAHTAFLIVARVGDDEGDCTIGTGCANGQYYLARDVVGDVNDPDPILELAAKLATWRSKQQGKPDHVLSTVVVDRQRLVADGASRATVTVELRDIDDVALGHGGDTITVAWDGLGSPNAMPGPVTDNGDGTYTFELVATADAGRGLWNLVVDFGGPKTRQLWPPLSLESVPLTDLHSGYYDYPAGSGLEVPFEINRGAGEAGRGYHLLGTLSGTVPGVTIGAVLVPLNRDPFFESTWFQPGAPDFPGSIGVLDGMGRAEARLVLDPAVSAALVGQRFDFCALLAGPGGEVTSVVGFPVIP
jgi:Family of unknown function (DUF1028)/Invasin, domain 3